MHVWDAEGRGEIHFDSRDVSEPVLGYIIEDNALRSSLFTKLSEYSNIDFISPIQLTVLQQKPEHIELVTKDQKSFSAKLLIAADGANSWVREEVKIALKTWDYEHTAIVTTVQTEKPHQQTAWQRFLPTGPLAFLPLTDTQTCSIVWSATPDYAKELLAYDDAAFCSALTTAFAEKLGHVISVATRHHFHLHMRHAKNYVLPRLALIGDAAHTIHPLAGQGVNLGMLDAICLAEIVTQAHKKSRDFASFATLRQYERWRKSDNLVMLGVVEGLKALFASDKTIIKSLRNLGLNITNQAPFIKNVIVNYALGKRKNMPGTAFPAY